MNFNFSAFASSMSPGKHSNPPSEKPCPNRSRIPSKSPHPRGHLLLSLRGAIISPLSYTLRRSVLKDALRDALGDRRLAFVLFSRWATAHTTVAGLPAISWAWTRLEPPAKTTSPDLQDAPTPEGMACSPRGAGLVLPAPQKGVSL